MEERKNFIVWSSRNGTSGWYVVIGWDTDDEDYVLGPYQNEGMAMVAAEENGLEIVKSEKDEDPEEKTSKSIGF